MTTASQTETRAIPWWLVLLEGIFAVIIGIFLLSNTAVATVVLIQVLGIYWIVKGIFSLVSMFIDHSMWGWKLFAGILGIVAGFIVLDNPLWSTFIVGATLIIVLGIQGIIVGIINLVQAFRGGGWGVGILGILSILLGIILLANVWVFTFSLPIVIGIFALVGGVIAIVQAFRLRS